MTSVGGVIVTDNMLYPEKYRQDMRKFSDYLKQNSNFELLQRLLVMGKKLQ